MKVLNAKIHWHSRFANNPTLIIEVDQIPKYEDLRFEIKENIYYAEKEGFVSFGYYDFERGGNQGGYGGAKWTLNMKDGSKKEVWGSWSSNSSGANRYFPKCREVQINGIGCAITFELYCKILEDFPEVTLIEERGFDIIVLKDGRRKPKWEPDLEVIEILKEKGEYMKEIQLQPEKYYTNQWLTASAHRGDFF